MFYSPTNLYIPQSLQTEEQKADIQTDSGIYQYQDYYTKFLRNPQSHFDLPSDKKKQEEYDRLRYGQQKTDQETWKDNEFWKAMPTDTPQPTEEKAPTGLLAWYKRNKLPIKILGGITVLGIVLMWKD